MNADATQELKGRTVVVTGASSGIGAAAARRFAERGATVAVVGRSPEKTAAVAEAIGGQAHLADYSRLDDVRRLAEELLDRYARIDVLANNAGGPPPACARQAAGDDPPVEFLDSFGRRGELILRAHRISDPRHRRARIEQHDIGTLLREPDSVRRTLTMGTPGNAQPCLRDGARQDPLEIATACVSMRVRPRYPLRGAPLRHATIRNGRLDS
jgi:NAD(P)-dependent dehydrogenase (short-subunit alcohol dehydrogenase family)